MSAPFHLRKIAILGAGLIGGSILRACHERTLADAIAVYDMNPKTRKRMQKLAWPKVTVASSPNEAVRDADLVLVCVPLSAVKKVVKAALPGLSPKTIVTDVGSVKQKVVAQLEPLLKGKAKWVGGHPMAGRAINGFEAGTAALFTHAKIILTPTSRTDRTALKTVTHFWQALGGIVVRLTPKEHDRRVAEISHVFHLAVASETGSVSTESLPFAGPGFKDSTRIASSPGHLWQEILIANKTEVLRILDTMITGLKKSRRALAKEDAAKIEAIFDRANQKRKKLESLHKKGATA